MKLMEVREIGDKESWENFFRECREKTFLNAFNWGEFQKTLGNKIWRLGIFKGDNIAAAALAVKIAARRGTFLFVPHGPAVKIQDSELKPEILEQLLARLKALAYQEKASFIRVAPIWKRNAENSEIFKNLKFRPAPLHIHPESTWELDISRPETELLAAMRKTTRYLVRQGLSNADLKVIKSVNISDIDKFKAIYKETVLKHQFVPFSPEYLKKEFSAFLPDSEILLMLSSYRGEVLAGAVIIFWQGIGFYHHGASSQKHPKVPASYLLQWEAIREAKRRGCELYNFWGIAEKNVKCQMSNVKSNKNHPWAGLTLFKQGFGGYKKEYLKTQDFIISNNYWLNFLVENLRRRKRRY